MAEPEPPVGDDELTHEAWEKRLGRIGEVVSAWARRTANEPPPVEVGSSLYGDDRDFHDVRVSHVAWYSIAVAVEHLDFFIDTLRATRSLYPSAYLTVLRTALIGGAQSVWVLHPGRRQDRRRRALNIYADDLSNQIKTINTAHLDTERARDLADRSLGSLRERQAELQCAADKVGGIKNVAAWTVDTTTVIRKSTEAVHGDEAILNAGVNVLWRRGSSAAHGGRSLALWSVTADDVITGATGSKYARLTGDLARDIGPAAVAATMMTNRAIELFDDRRIAHGRR